MLNSEFEATAYSLIEARMLGLPVIAKESSGSAEVITAGIDGLLYSPGNKFGLGECILELLNNPIKAEKIALKGRIDAFERFNQQNNFPAILNLLKSVND